jgi:hypothetical protein
MDGDSFDIIDMVSKKLESMINPIASGIKRLADQVEAAIVGEANYEETMKYFIIHKNDDDRIAKGVLIKEKTDEGYTKLTQLFLDNENNIVCKKNGAPLGRNLKLSKLDNELLKVFKEKNYIIVT